jgi:hypothetical protein
MAYKSRFTGAKIDELLEIVQNQQTNPGLVIENVTGEQLLAKMTGQQIIDKMTGQQIIDKINSVGGNIVFTKFVDCQGGGGKEGV